MSGPVGRSMPGRSNRRLVRGLGRYVGDIWPDGVLSVIVVRSPYPHATIAAVDTSAAVALAGVVAVVTGEEIRAETKPIPEGWDTSVVGAKRVDWYALAADRVRYVGEAVAAVVAVDRATAEQAAALVEIEYDTLPPVTTAGQALAADAPLVAPEWGDNILYEQRFEEGDAAAALAAHRTIRGTIASQRVSGAPIEPRGIVATWDESQRLLRIWESTQQPHLVRSYVAQSLGIAENDVVVVQPHVGGAFGLKQPTSQEEVLLGYLALRLRRPVRWIEQRFEGLSIGGHAREASASYAAAFDDEGRLAGLQVDLVADVGAPTAYLGWGMSVVTMFTLPTVYAVPAIDVRLRSVVTNKCPWTPCRGFGKDIATLLMERVMDGIAGELGLDPVEVRRRNLIQPDEFPYHHASGGVLDSGDYPALLAKAAAAFDPAAVGELRRQAAARGMRIGLGIAMELTPEGVAIPGSLMNNAYDGATVRITPTGEVTVLAGVTTPGTGNDTALAQIAAEALHCDLDRVSVIQGDSDACPWGLGNYSSRSVIVGGSAVHVAAEQLDERLRTVAASMLAVVAGDLVVTEERYATPDGSSSVTFMEVVERIYWHAFEAHSDTVEPALESTRYYRIGNINHQPAEGERPGLYPTWASGAAACLVEVDPETGAVRVIGYTAVEDAGTLINPLLATAQLHGGIAFGLGTALYEQLQYDAESGQFQSATFMDYTIPTAVEIPSLSIVHQVTPSPFTVHGTKGVGESGLGGALAVVCSAVENAFPELDLRLSSVPLTPAVVWRAIQTAGARP